MTEDRLPHRLTVVWFTDLVGYSSLAAQDEDRAIALVRRFQAAVRAAIPPDRGRIVKFIGDAALVESPSAESALVAAATLRESLGDGEAVRTGVHLADVAVAPDGDLYGDGVNTAQRIQTEAEPGQIVVSELVAQGLRSRPAFRFESLGERALKGVEPVRLFLVTAVETAPAAEASRPDGWPARAEAPGSADAEERSIAQRIVETLKVQLTPRQKARIAERPTEDVQAYEWYLKGRHFLSRRTEATLRQAIERFRRAVAADPSFAQAWVGLADGLVLLAQYSPTPLAEVADEARAAGERALALDPDLGEAEVSLGFLADAEWSWEEAERRYRRGLELRPGYAFAHHWFGGHLIAVGRHEEAIVTLRRALSLDPLSLPIQMALGVAFTVSGRLEDSLEVYRKAIELDPAFAPTYNNIAISLLALGRFEESLEAEGESSRLNPDVASPRYVEALRAGYAEGGVQGYWEAQHRWSSAHIQDEGAVAYLSMAVSCTQLGQVDEAFEHLKRVVALRVPLAPSLRSPLLAPLRSDPRFTEIERKLGLA